MHRMNIIIMEKRNTCVLISTQRLINFSNDPKRRVNRTSRSPSYYNQTHLSPPD